MLQYVEDFAPAFYSLKVLSGGLRGTAGTRSTTIRRLHPRTCSLCHAHDPAWVWTTPSATHPGVAWCQACQPPCSTGFGWTMVLQAHGDEDRSSLPPLPSAHSSLLRTPTTYDRCPLCGWGELSSQHILHWCPAVATAWLGMRPAGADDSIVAALVGDASHLTLVASLLWQASRMAGALAG